MAYGKMKKSGNGGAKVVKPSNRSAGSGTISKPNKAASRKGGRLPK